MADNYLSVLDVEDLQGVKLKDSEARLAIGTLSSLKTTNKSNLVAAINEAIEIDKIFRNINEMISVDIPIGDVAMVLDPSPTYWIIENSGTPSLICRELTSGNYAKLLNKSPINLGALNSYSEFDDISSDLQFLLDSGYNEIELPEGQYKCSVSLGSNISISGAHIGNTNLIPVNHGKVFSINGDYIKITDLWMKDVPPYGGIGIGINETSHCSNSHFENLTFENFINGLVSVGDMIWNEFTNCNFIGCFNHGFVITSATAYFNNNAFYSCKFNNNVNAGLVIDVSEVHDYANVFYSCNIEYNAQDRFGQQHIDQYAVLNTGFTSFIGCYFEGNGADDTYFTIKNFDQLNLIGCCFIQERILVDNNHGDCITNFIGNKQYQCVGYVSTQATEVNLFGNNFTLT